MVNMSKTKEGMVVMNPDSGPREMKSVSVTTEFVKSSGAVTIAALTDEYNAKNVSTSEVSWSDLRPAQNITGQEAIKKAIDALCGVTQDRAEVILSGMAENSLINGFRILKPGQSYSSDVNPGRVQVFTDKNGIVQTAELG